MEASNKTMTTYHLHFGDYLVFGAVLLLCAAIGIVSCVLSRKRNTVVDFLFGGRNMATLPVLVSMTVTFVTPFTLLGHPAEIYHYGIHFVLIGLSQAIGVALAALLFVPLLHPLQLTSNNQVGILLPGN